MLAEARPDPRRTTHPARALPRHTPADEPHHLAARPDRTDQRHLPATRHPCSKNRSRSKTASHEHWMSPRWLSRWAASAPTPPWSCAPTTSPGRSAPSSTSGRTTSSTLRPLGFELQHYPRTADHERDHRLHRGKRNRAHPAGTLLPDHDRLASWTLGWSRGTRTFPNLTTLLPSTSAPRCTPPASARDELLAAGKIEEAEAYMEARRQVFWDNGYAIRKLNQAYFAFYGAYADVPGGRGRRRPRRPGGACPARPERLAGRFPQHHFVDELLRGPARSHWTDPIAVTASHPIPRSSAMKKNILISYSA